MPISFPENVIDPSTGVDDDFSFVWEIRGRAPSSFLFCGDQAITSCEPNKPICATEPFRPDWVNGYGDKSLKQVAYEKLPELLTGIDLLFSRETDLYHRCACQASLGMGFEMPNIDNTITSNYEIDNNKCMMVKVGWMTWSRDVEVWFSNAEEGEQGPFTLQKFVTYNRSAKTSGPRGNGDLETETYYGQNILRSPDKYQLMKFALKDGKMQFYRLAYENYAAYDALARDERGVLLDDSNIEDYLNPIPFMEFDDWKNLDLTGDNAGKKIGFDSIKHIGVMAIDKFAIMNVIA